MLRVLNLLNSNHRRGAESFGIDLGAALEGAGVSVRTVALTATDAAAAHDIETLAPPDAHGLAWLRPLRSLAREADVVIGHGGRTLVAGSIVCPLTATPFVYRVIGEPGAWASSATRRARVAFELRRATRIAVYYEGVRPELVDRFHVRPDRVVVVPKGIDTVAFPPVTPRSRASARARLGLADAEAVALYLGALSPAKNVDQVVEAGALVLDLVTLVVGEGPDRDRLEAQARRSDGRLRILSATDDPLDLLHAADVLALTSRTEGMPTVLLEAALVGLPVVATAVGGVPDLVDPGVTGILVDLDNVPATTDALRAAIGQRDTMGAAARQRGLDRFDITNVVGAWTALLNEATSA